MHSISVGPGRAGGANLPFAIEDGEGTGQHELVLNLAAASEPLMGWVYDTDEVASGITFNPQTPAAVKVRATS